MNHTLYESRDSIIMRMSFLSARVLCIVDFDQLVHQLNGEDKAAVQKQCRDWKELCEISDSSEWNAGKEQLIKSVGLSLTRKLDNLWKQLHPSQSTGLSHSIHSTSVIDSRPLHSTYSSDISECGTLQMIQVISHDTISYHILAYHNKAYHMFIILYCSASVLMI